MKQDQRIILSSWCQVLRKLKKVIVCNTATGVWIKISEEAYNLLLEAVNEKITVENFLLCFEDTDDRTYMHKLIEKLFEIQVLCHPGEDMKIPLEEVQFSVTNRCNLSCAHCCYDASGVNGKPDLSTEEIKQCFDKILQQPIKNLCITGGEPLLRSDLFEILEYIRGKFNGRLSLMSNGTLITTKNVSQLIYYFDAFNLSIDGVDEATCSQIRGKGVFDKVVNAIKLLKGHGAKETTLSMVMTEGNIHYEKQFEALCADLGVKGMKRVFSPLGRGLRNKNRLLQKKITHTLKVSDDKNQRARCRSCKAGFREIYVDYDGSIYPCGLLIFPDLKLGQLMEISNFSSYCNSIQKTTGWNNLKQSLPENNNSPCKNCNVNLFCWSCPGVYLGALKAAEQFNMHCSGNKNILLQEFWTN